MCPLPIELLLWQLNRAFFFLGIAVIFAFLAFIWRTSHVSRELQLSPVYPRKEERITLKFERGRDLEVTVQTISKP